MNPLGKCVECKWLKIGSPNDAWYLVNGTGYCPRHATDAYDKIRLPDHIIQEPA